RAPRGRRARLDAPRARLGPGPHARLVRRPPVPARGGGHPRPAVRWGDRVQRVAQPLAYPAIRGPRRRGPVGRVPGIGVVVSDAATAREVLLDTDRFSKVGPGAPSDLWTPVLGPSVLLNMEGADHARLRRTLAGLFTPRAVRELVAVSVPAALAGLAPRLLAGERVDLVAETAAMAGTVICAMTGLPPTD